jgi:hypothetical protein
VLGESGAALTGGYHVAFAIGALFAVAAAAAGAVLLHTRSEAAVPESEAALLTDQS